jgi:hypothetical protein
MFNEENSVSNAPPSGRVFLQQTSAAVYAGGSEDAEVLTRLQEGKPFDILPVAEDAGAGWFAIRTSAGETGFIRSNTKTTTPERLRLEREAVQRGYAIGQGKMAMGAAIFLFGCATIFYFFLFEGRAQGPFALYYGAIAVGAGEFLWGLEQVVHVRAALGKFDALWREAFQ